MGGPAHGAESAPSTATINASWEVWQLPENARDRVHPIDWEFTVLYYDAEWSLLWVESDGIPDYVPLAGKPLDLHFGQRVRVSGLLVPSKGLDPDLVRIDELASAARPQAVREFDPAQPDPSLEAHFVSVEGVIHHQVLIDRSHAALDLLVDGEPVTVRVLLSPGEVLPSLTATTVRAEGVYVGEGEDEDRTHTVWVASPQNLAPLASIESNAIFERPVTPLDQIGQAPEGELIRVQGRVHAYQPGKHLILRDGTGQTVVESRQRLALELGERAEAVGRIARKEGITQLVTALLRRCEKATDSTAAASADLRLAAEVHALSSTEAAKGRPVHIFGTVVWSHPEEPYFFLHDSSRGVKVHLDPSIDWRPQPGFSVELYGHSAMGAFAPVVQAMSLQTHGFVELPKAEAVSLGEAMSGARDAQWVEISGYVRGVEHDSEWTRVYHTTPLGEFVARTRRDPSLDRLKDTVARLQGVCVIDANARRQVEGVVFMVPSSEFFAVVDAPPAAPEELALRSLGSLREYQLVLQQDRWIRVRGTVLHQLPDRLFLQDGPDALEVHTRTEERFVPGTVVEVVGLPVFDGQHSSLREGRVRDTGKRDAPEAVSPLPGKSTTARLDRRLVTLEGTIHESRFSPSEALLILRREGTEVEARLSGEVPPELKLRFAPGAVVRLSGVLILPRREHIGRSNSLLLLRSAEDLALLEAAPWWTGERALRGLTIAAGAIGAILLWTFFLRRRIRHQTGQIRAGLRA
ncbi:MAG: hypothetical protein ACLFR7_05660, partial [Opitutales bacterium]